MIDNSGIVYQHGDVVIDIRDDLRTISTYSISIVSGIQTLVKHSVSDGRKNKHYQLNDFIKYIYPIRLVGSERNTKNIFIGYQHWIESDIQSYIYKKGKECSVDEIKQKINKNNSYKHETIEAYIRSMLVNRFLELSEKNGVLYVDINKYNHQKSKEIEYFELITNELQAKSKRVELLINLGCSL
ncbi:hypothetical protein FUA23_22065 [Neolewinella aurantiaca]|uniref:Uncharacterized protein n=1 Tax=Neolewinella aurantiaca TaxID=2602767 RepID=A0A5C7FC06_9BACT|nr:hypothetical protein [Neolewinella aurantiaca]TXF81186.1 hypothetical protein FUA23_22065 [Neolewinella aurantiaca]